MMDLLNETRLRQKLKQNMILHLPEREMGSTNTTARTMFCDQKQLPVLVATTWQTGGRGTRGRSFYGCQGGGLYLSLAMKNCFPLNLLGLVTPAVAVAVVHALQRVCNLDAGIKWVNDIIVDGKKISGILCETGFDATGMPEVLTIGVGINLKAGLLPKELVSIATALDVFCEEIDVTYLCAEIVNAICDQLNTLEQKSFLSDYRRYSVLNGKRISYKVGDISLEATVCGIDENARLIVTLDGERTVTLECGDVSVRLVE